MMRKGLTLLLLFAASGCGGEDPPPPPPKRKAAAPRSAPKAAASKPTKQKSSNTSRLEGIYEPDVVENLRVTLTSMDFVPDPSGEENRDPFRSYVIAQAGLGTGSSDTQKAATDRCKKRRNGRMISALVANQEPLGSLKLRGIVYSGRSSRALFSGPGRTAYSVGVGDCLGAEKAKVRAIFSTYIRIEMPQEGTTAEEKQTQDIRLHPEELRTGQEGR